MEAISAVASFAGLVDAALRTVRETKEYVDSAQEARATIQLLSAELAALKEILDRTRPLLREAKPPSSSSSASNERPALWTYMAISEGHLQELVRSFPPGRAPPSRGERLRWPWKEKRTLKALSDIRAFVQTLQFCVSVGSCQLLTGSVGEMEKLLQKQIENIGLLKQMEQELMQTSENVASQLQLLRNDTQEKVLDWIFPPYDGKQTAMKEARAEGTGGWLLEHPLFAAWKNDSSPQHTNNVLWCHGVQGTGKSVFTSIVVDHLSSGLSRQHEDRLCFYYFDYLDVESHRPAIILAALIRQLLDHQAEIPPPILEGFKKKTRLSINSLERILFSILANTERTFIIMDALDECDDIKHRSWLLNVVRQLQRIDGVKLFLTSRKYHQGIDDTLSAFPQVAVVASLMDLRTYVKSEIDRLGLLENSGSSITCTSVEEAVIHKSGGLFLLAKLHVQRLASEPTVGDMLATMKELSDDLSDAFEETIGRIRRLPGKRKHLGMAVLMWVALARRPLSALELVEALSIRPGVWQQNTTFRPTTGTVLECCYGLVHLDPITQTIVTTHGAVQRYLLQHQTRLFPDGPGTVAESCVTYLLFETLASGPKESKRLIEQVQEDHPLLSYCAQFSGVHVSAIRTADGQLTANIDRFVWQILHSPVSGLISQIWHYDRGFIACYWDAIESNSSTPLRLAIRCGFQEATRRILAAPETDVNASTSIGSNAIMAAVCAGDVPTTRLLLQHGADPLIRNRYGDALQCAAEAGQPDTIHVLVAEHGMDPNQSYGRCWMRPLCCCLARDSVEAFEMLLDLGAELACTSSRDTAGHDRRHHLGGHVIQVALAKRSFGIVECMMRRNIVAVRVRDGPGRPKMYLGPEVTEPEIIVEVNLTDDVAQPFADEEDEVFVDNTPTFQDQWRSCRTVTVLRKGYPAMYGASVSA